MTPAANTAPATDLDLTQSEQWAVHQAFLDYVTVAVRDDTSLPKPSVELRILEKLEGDDHAFTAFELDRLRYECAHHANSDQAPARDRAPARAVVRKIDRLDRSLLDG